MNGRVIICTGGPTRQIVDEKGKSWTFEMHPYCGPWPLKKNGDPVDNPPPEKSSFWRVVSWWAQQGQKLGEDGLCIWAKPPEPKMIHLGGRHYKAVYE